MAIMAVPRARCSQLSAVLTGTKFAALAEDADEDQGGARGEGGELHPGAVGGRQRRCGGVSGRGEAFLSGRDVGTEAWWRPVIGARWAVVRFVFAPARRPDWWRTAPVPRD
jgi:hypothetical protein